MRPSYKRAPLAAARVASVLLMAALGAAEASRAVVTIDAGIVSAGADFGCSPGQTPAQAQPPSSFSLNVFYDFADLTMRGFGTSLSAGGWANATWNVPGGDSPHITIAGSSQEGFNGSTCAPAVGGVGWVYGRGHSEFTLSFTVDQPYRSVSTSFGVTGVANGQSVIETGSHTISGMTVGKSGGFSLDLALTPGPLPSCSEIVQSAVINGTEKDDCGRPTKEVALFTPNFNLTQAQAAKLCGYVHFNWYSLVTYDPYAQVSNISNVVPYHDPPTLHADGTPYGLPGIDSHPLEVADAAPFYWNESGSGDYSLASHIDPTGTILQFVDIPGDDHITPGQPEDYVGFATSLVGVRADGTSDVLYTFLWSSNFNGNVGSVQNVRSNLVTPGPGEGGIFGEQSNVDVATLSPAVRNLMVRDGATNVPGSPDTTPPVASAALSPAANGNGWNNTNVVISITATDSEQNATGVQQITYSAAGAQTVGSTVVAGSSASLTISSEGTTTVTFFATDNAGNNEAPQQVSVKIDKTRPTITGSVTPAANANGWNNSAVTVSFLCSDSLSGLAPGSPPGATVLTAEGANQSVTGTCTDLAGNSASQTVQGINIGKTPPAVACSARPNLLWPPNGKLVPVDVMVEITSALSGPGGFVLSSVTSSEPDSGGGDIQGFVTGTASTSGELRAERLGTGTGRLYTFTYTGMDLAGNSAQCETEVVVPKKRKSKLVKIRAKTVS